MASAFEIFSRAERIELAAADLYRVLGETFDWAPGDRALMKRLQEEEVQHAARIRLLSAQYRSEPRLFAVTPRGLQLLDEAEQAERLLLEELAAGRWQGDLAGLKARLAELEERCGTTHADVLAEGADPRVAAFFRELAAQDRAHRELLLRAAPGARRRGDDER